MTCRNRTQYDLQYCPLCHEIVLADEPCPMCLTNSILDEFLVVMEEIEERHEPSPIRICDCGARYDSRETPYCPQC
jgi:hypothetical protein